jgi:hypothetical protein
MTLTLAKCEKALQGQPVGDWNRTVRKASNILRSIAAVLEDPGQASPTELAIWRMFRNAPHVRPNRSRTIPAYETFRDIAEVLGQFARREAVAAPELREAITCLQDLYRAALPITLISS